MTQSNEKLELIGIDHPVIERLADQWRQADSLRLGATATIGLDHLGGLSVWLVHLFGSKHDSGAHIIPIAVDQEVKRIPSVEKQYRESFQASIGRVQFQPSERTELLHRHIEPTLQRELGYRGIATPEKGYSTELLAWLEVE